MGTECGIVGHGEARAAVGGATTFAAGLHVSAAASSAFILEYSLGANPMLHELAEEDFPVKDGYIEIPDRPGLGVTIDPDFVERHRVNR